MGKLFSSQEKSDNFKQTGKIREFYPNTGKVMEIYPKYWKSEGIFTIFYFYCFLDFVIEVCLLNRFFYLLNSLNKMPKKYWKVETKYWKNQGKVGEIC